MIINYGCVPSKVLAAANTAHQVNHSDKFGIKAEIVSAIDVMTGAATRITPH